MPLFLGPMAILCVSILRFVTVIFSSVAQVEDPIYRDLLV